jgi:tRNA dimethylallyltransferase
MRAERRPCVVVCGPTASGKSGLADGISSALSTFAVLVDSMQVYREIPVTTNQARERPARLSGVVSVRDEWSVANHREAVIREAARLEDPLVLDAGTGMYLNASILDIPLARNVTPQIRDRAHAETLEASNPRRASRARELELSGGDERGSIWDGEPVYDLKVVYLRPEIHRLEEAIRRRSRKIVSSGIREAELLSEMLSKGARINASVLESIGVKELLSLLSGETDETYAEERINIRTRRLAKRQIRWFDKLRSTLEGRAVFTTLDPGNDAMVKNTMHDIIAAWNR